MKNSLVPRSSESCEVVSGTLDKDFSFSASQIKEFSCKSVRVQGSLVSSVFPVNKEVEAVFRCFPIEFLGNPVAKIVPTWTLFHVPNYFLSEIVLVVIEVETLFIVSGWLVVGRFLISVIASTATLTGIAPFAFVAMAEAVVAFLCRAVAIAFTNSAGRCFLLRLDDRRTRCEPCRVEHGADVLSQGIDVRRDDFVYIWNFVLVELRCVSAHGTSQFDLISGFRLPVSERIRRKPVCVKK